MKEYIQGNIGKETFEVKAGRGLSEYIHVYDWLNYPEGCLYLEKREAEELIHKLRMAVKYLNGNLLPTKEESK